MEYIDAIVYINLAYRTDRREHIEQEILKLCKDSSKVIRIDAIKHNIGALGCALSHIEALKKIYENPSFKNCIIFEDDFMFKEIPNYDINNIIKKFFETVSVYDIFLLGYNKNTLKFTQTPHIDYVKVLSANAAHGYIINRNFIPKLLNNFKVASQKLEKINQLLSNEPQNNYDKIILFQEIENLNIDQTWVKLQPNSNWYTTIPALGFQINGYSDIGKTHRDKNIDQTY